jgi:hypothetical protein
MGVKDELLVALFNRIYKEGDKIKMRDDSGDSFEAVVDSSALILSGHTPVVFIKGKGAYSLTRLIVE